MMAGMDSLQKLLAFLDELEKRNIFYSLARHTPDAIMVSVTVPGERWEIEFFADARMEIEVFKSNGTIEGEQSLDRLFNEFSD
jgi:hypothetical protein